MSARAPLAIFLLLACLEAVAAEFTDDFHRFLDTRYGSIEGARLEREDMGRFLWGSFGGRLDADQPINNEPVVFIHGVTLRAGVFMAHRRYFIDRGYSQAELYATTYADGGLTPMYWMHMRCSDVKQIRQFLEAVHEYTNKTMDVIAYSMGVAITRKAILGGECVDTGEDLGPPLTDFIDTFLGVAGVAYGLENCPVTFEACNKRDGMVCTSEFLRDLNSQPHRYEGHTSYALYSRDDYLVGQNCCGHRCSELHNANLTVVRRGHDHISILTATKDIQYSLVRHHRVNV